MLNCGIKHCGGCNPTFNREKLTEELIKQLKNVKISTAFNGVCFQALIVINGCCSCCAAIDEYKYDHLFMLYDASQFDDLVKKINELAEDY